MLYARALALLGLGGAAAAAEDAARILVAEPAFVERQLAARPGLWAARRLRQVFPAHIGARRWYCEQLMLEWADDRAAVGPATPLVGPCRLSAVLVFGLGLVTDVHTTSRLRRRAPNFLPGCTR